MGEAAMKDASLDALMRAPFRLHSPSPQTLAFVFASPHSGRTYPASFVAQSRLSFEALRRSEDAFVEELFLPVVTEGAPLIAASFPRAYLDVNRAPQEFDAQMFEGSLPFAVDSSSPRVNAGLGVIPRVVREGVEIYPGKISAAEASRRLSVFYRPYHDALGELVRETREHFGVAVVIDCHSMPSAAAAPDIVLGDRYGISAGAGLMRVAEEAFMRQGFSVARNAPYAGGYTTQIYGRPGRGTHALQIEINRALYMDEDRVRPSASFAEFQGHLCASLKTLLAQAPELLLPRGFRHAAE